MNNPDGIRMSTSLTYLNPVRHRLNLTVRSGVTAHRLIFDGNRVVGVDVESGGERFVVEGDEFICCGGAVGSPQLLLLSGVGPAGHLQEMGVAVHHELPGVGQNLRDHPNVRIPIRVKEDFPLDPGGAANPACPALHRRRFRRPQRHADSPVFLLFSHGRRPAGGRGHPVYLHH